MPFAKVPTRISLSIGERTSNVPVAVALLAVDEVAVIRAEAGLGLLEPGLVGLLELLVVGAQGRVGDLDPLSGHRRAPVEATVRVGVTEGAETSTLTPV